MDIHGLMKMTLLDYPGHVACTVFLAGCNLRCPYCHNSELIDKKTKPLMDDKELLAFLKKRKGLLDGVAFTGGEPLMSEGLEDLIVTIRNMSYSIKLDTNGCFPDRLKKLIDRGLIDYIAMDIKNSPERYYETAGTKHLDFDKIRESISVIMNSSADYEFRTTVVKELFDEKSFEGIGDLIRGAKNYFLQAFTDRDTVIYSGFHAPEKEDMERYKEIMLSYVDHADIRGMD